MASATRVSRDPQGQPLTPRTAGRTVRLADPRRDAAAVAGIYRPAVEGSHISFEETAPGADEMARRIGDVMARTPWLVAVDGDAVIGYAYAGWHRQRAGYRWSVEISAYVAAEHRGTGVGRLLYDPLLSLLRRQRFVNAYAGIALPNPASVALHEAIGMQLIGVYEGIGFKAGAWRDVAWYGLRLADAEDPLEPIPLPELAGHPELAGSLTPP